MQASGSEQMQARASVGGVSLLVLLTLSMQIVLGGEGLALGEAGRDASSTRVCLRRAPIAVVGVIRDLVERREPSGEPRAVQLCAMGEGLGPVRAEGRRVRSGDAMGLWLLDLPPPVAG